MNFDFIKNMAYEKKVFYIFLLVHLLVWSSIGLIRTVLPTDSLEGIYWGSLHDFGTPKHPPLAGWLTYLIYIIFKSDFSIYFLSQAFIIAGFIYIHRLAKYFLDENKAMLSVILLEGTWCYSYVTGYYGFNPDVILLFILPAITYYFYNCMKDNKQSDWIKLGVLIGISFLNKYQTGLIILPMAIWAFMFNIKTFKNKYFYMSILIAFVIFLPHLLWLIKYDFFPFMYFEGELTATSWYNHITAPLLFVLMQLVAILGTLLIYLSLKLRSKSAFVINKDTEKSKALFLLLLGFVPLAIHVLMGLFEGGTMRPRWGFEFWYMTGIMLFYFFPCKINKKEYVFATKFSYVLMLIVFLSLGTLLTVEKNYRSRYPVSTIYNDLQGIWSSECNSPLKYIGGYIEWTLPLTIYGESHPKCLLDTLGYKDPWISQESLKSAGIIVMDRTSYEVKKHVKQYCQYLSDKYPVEPVEYRFILYNALKMPREYLIYYFIVPPMK